MENGLKELLESNVLSEETKTAFLEAWNHKLDEARNAVREEVETQVREEYATRFAADKAELVEAMDRMLTDAVKAHATETFDATKALKAERARLTQAVKEARGEYNTRLASNIKMVETFVLEQLKSELVELSADHNAIKAQRVRLANEISEAKAQYEAKLAETADRLQGFVVSKLSEELSKLATQQKQLAEQKVFAARKLREHRMELNSHTAAGINKLEAFVVEQMSKEISELHIDKRNLVEAKVRMVSEAKQKMDETRKAFITRASKLVESTVEKHLRAEMTQLKDDLREARENLFGRRLFEAFQSEFMTSYLAEGTKVKKLMNQLNEAESQLNESAARMAEQAKLMESMQRRAHIAEGRAQRERTLNELLSPLAKDKRAVMGELLESVKTDSLKTAFHKYLPAVLNESAKGSTTQGRRTLAEASAPTAKRTVAVTGNRPNNRLAESARAEDVSNTESEIIELRRLAGLEK